MKKSELIRALDDLDDDDEVYMSYYNHDYAGTFNVVDVQVAEFRRVRPGGRLVTSEMAELEEDEEKFVLLDYDY